MFQDLVDAGRHLVARLEKYRDRDIGDIPPGERMASSEVSAWFTAARTMVKTQYGQDSEQMNRWGKLQDQMYERQKWRVERGEKESDLAIVRIHESMGLLTEFHLLGGGNDSMSTQIDQDAALILRALATAPRNEYVEGPTLASDTGLDPDRINDAVALLVDAGHAEWNQVMGTAPFDFGDAMVTPRGRHEFQRLSQPSGDSAPKSGGPLVSSRSIVRLFISHCSDDVELAARLVALFRVALNIPSSAIRCSSVDGYRLPGGANTDEQLRREVHDAEAFVGIVSSASVRSLYVLFELGARWGARRQMIPLLAPGTPATVLGGPLAGLNALSAGSVPQLHQLLSELAASLSLNLESAAGYHDQLQAVADLTARSTDSHPAPATQASGGGSDLPKEAEGVLKALVTSNELTPEDIAGQVGLSEQKVEYFLDLLKERELADEIMYSGRPSEFVVTSKGRKYLFEHGMLE